MTKRVGIGEILTQWPGETWNRLVDNLDDVEQIERDAFQEGASELQHGLLTYVRNGTGQDLPPFSVVGLDEFRHAFPTLVNPSAPPANNPAGGVLFQPPLINGVAPATALSSGITQRYCEGGAVVPAMYWGYTFVRVDRTSESHDKAQIVEGDPTAMVSGTAGFDVRKWELEDEANKLGDQWALVLLGQEFNQQATLSGVIGYTLAQIPAATEKAWSALSQDEQDALNENCQAGQPVLFPGKAKVAATQILFVDGNMMVALDCESQGTVVHEDNYRGKLDPDGGTISLPDKDGTETKVRNGHEIKQFDWYSIESTGTIGATVVSSIPSVFVAQKENPSVDADWSVVNTDQDGGDWYNMSNQPVAANTWVQGKKVSSYTFVDVEPCP